MKNYQNLSILFWLYTAKASKRTGKAPVYLRLTLNGKRSELSIGISIHPSLWDKKLNKAKGRGDDVKIVNNRIDAVRSKILYHYNHLILIRNEISVEDIKNEYLGIKEKGKTLIEVFDYHNEKLKEKITIGAMASGTLKRYEVTKSKVSQFIQYHFKKQDIFLADIKYQFAVDFEHFLRVKQKIGNNTAMKYIKNLKKIINMAVQHQWINNNPINSFKCPYLKVKKEVLTPEELEILINKNFAVQRLQEINDVFIFSCFTGFSYSDLESLSPADIVKGIDGELWIYKDRQKTGNQEKVPLLPLPMEIIEKYKDHPNCIVRNRLLPVKSNQKYNTYLSEIAEICGINKKLTSHTARHTFATTVLLSNDVSLEIVKEVMGHEDIRTTQIYARILQSKLSQEMKRLKIKFDGTVI